MIIPMLRTQATPPALRRPLATFVVGLLPLLATPAAAQEPEKNEGESGPAKATPLFDKRPLRIPNRVRPEGGPELKTTNPKPSLKEPPPGMLAPGKPGAAPLPAEAADGRPAQGDLKKTAEKGCVPLRGRDTVQFEFKNADIQDVVAAISKHLCKNFIVTSKIRSQKFDIISPTPVTVDEAWQAFLSALEANDFAMFQVGSYYKIIQATEGTRAPVPIYGEDGPPTPNSDRVMTRIWRVKHGGDPATIVNYLNVFKSAKGQIHPFAATGTIIVTDYATSIRRLETVLAEIDQPGVLEQVHVVSVQYATASEIAEKLTQVFEPTRAGAPKAGAPAVKSPSPAVRPADGTPAPGAVEEEGSLSVSKIIADDRTNKLIIIASQRALKQILELKRKLDLPSNEGEGLVHVLRLKHANAEELATTLSSLAAGRPTTGARASRTGARPAATPAAPTPGGAAGSASLFEGDVKVTADKATNSLVITASKSDLTSMKRVIEQLDVPRFQVFVEAVILEVSIKRDRTFGTSWFGGLPLTIDGQSSPIIFGSNPTQSLSAFQTIAANPLGLASLLGLSGALRGPTLEGTENFVRGGIPSVGVLLQALKSTNDVNVISTPHLLTMDNEEAEIKVNEKRPFPTGLGIPGLGGLGGLAGLAGQAGQAGQAGAALGGLGMLGGLGFGTTLNREDVGLTLKLKPQINDQASVRLELDQELSDVAGIDQVTGQVITSNRAAKTVVVVGDQESVVIGGLVRDRESTDESKIPVLGDIPLLGWLFKRQQTIAEKVNLLLVLTPYIIRGPEDFRRIYERKMQERRDFVDAFYGETREYRAAIDWDRKLGPVAKFRQGINDELLKPENDGPGSGDDLIIRPEVEEVLELPAGRAGDANAPSSPPPPNPTPAELLPDIPPMTPVPVE